MMLCLQRYIEVKVNYNIFLQCIFQVERGHRSSSSILHYYCDGEFFTKHPLFSTSNDALQIFLYYDELETCNPLGSKVKIHKLGTYMYSVSYMFKHLFQ